MTTTADTPVAVWLSTYNDATGCWERVRSWNEDDVRATITYGDYLDAKAEGWTLDAEEAGLTRGQRVLIECFAADDDGALLGESETIAR